MTCIYSTLKFVCKQASKYGFTPIITFDQPLWWKSTTILLSEPEGSDLKSLIIRLGGFHVIMSFLGSIGSLMAGSGLKEILQVAYADNAVTHMLSGKAVTRAIRGHLLIYSALYAMIASRAMGISLPNDTEGIEEMSVSSHAKEIDSASELLQDLMNNESDDDLLEQHADCLKKINQLLEEEKKNLSTRRTAKLWLQYLSMLEILQDFIKAERVGDWQMHLRALSDMLPYFAAAGHNNYAKSARIYLQFMQSLSTDHPDVYASFMGGLHVVRRSDRLWAGLSTDLIIEQVLMRSLKTTGGLTRGTGMSETQRVVWLLSMPIRAEINNAMQVLAGVDYSTSEQHVDMSESRQSRDTEDTLKILDFLKTRDPFKDDESLHNICSGVTADESVNVDNACAVGHNIMDKMTGNNVTDYSFKKKDKAITLDSRNSVKINGDPVEIDPMLLFQRLLTAGERSNELPLLFKYEMSGYPTSLFQSTGIMLAAQKHTLAETLLSEQENSVPVVEDNVFYVLDGGALIHRLPWQVGQTYEDILHMYVSYVNRKYKPCVVVFDGYSEEPSTKDAVHRQRARSHNPCKVNLELHMKLEIKKDDFLANLENKQLFITALSAELKKSSVLTKHAKQDADLLIVQTAVAASRNQTVVVVGDDTDLLVLLCFHASVDKFSIYFRSEMKTNAKKREDL